MDELVLNGSNLTFKDVYEVAFNKRKVGISNEANQRAKRSRAIIFKLANKGYPIYGLNRGVGWNKDKLIDKDFFEQYNENLIKAHCTGINPPCKIEEVRAMMLIRLNTALCGSSGMSIKLLHTYKDFLNHDIVPIVPSRGSVGQGDISTLSHIGLAMIGQGKVIFKGKKISALEAIRKAGLLVAKLGFKDGLSIVSSNAHAAALASLSIVELEKLISISNLVYCLGLEGLNGKIESLNEEVNKLRKFEGQIQSAKQCLNFLEGSYLFDYDENRVLQDSLSFRSGFNISGTVIDALNYVKKQLKIQLNTSDDNPCILVEKEEILVSSNFEITTLVVAFEMLNIALNHLSKAACYRAMKLSNPTFTSLSRFLTPNDYSIAYGTIQKCFTALDTENRLLANPSSMDYFALAGNIEDHASNSTLVIGKLNKIIDNIYYILGIEFMHAAQAIDLRKIDKMGIKTKKAYDAIRSEIPFLSKDRVLSKDIQKAYEIVKSHKLFALIGSI